MSGKREKQKRRAGLAISIQARRDEAEFDRTIVGFLDKRAASRRLRSQRRRYAFAALGLLVVAAAVLLTIAAALGGAR